jgi:phenylpyruvate tautomerase PptA (4-oxalocrotonate tautomerase family)
MPTYVCNVPPRRLTSAQKGAIAKSISHRHSEATGAPPFFVQVVVEESPTTERFLGGSRTDDHIWIRGDIRAGRSEEVRCEMMLKIMRDVKDITDITEDNIWVYVCNLAPTDMVEYGHVLPLPGKEREWFHQLPQSLQHYLATLGTTEENFTL